ncbi:MAG: hypothetical protein AAGJ35_05850 [Myxococcota bacterium]
MVHYPHNPSERINLRLWDLPQMRLNLLELSVRSLTLVLEVVYLPLAPVRSATNRKPLRLPRRPPRQQQGLHLDL